MTDAPSIAAIQAIIRRGVPLAESWRIEVLAAAHGTARVRLPRDPLLLRPGDTVSGPAIMGLADIAFWAALLGSTAGRDDSVTASMTVNFLRPVGPGPTIADARLLKRGRRLLFGEVLIRAEATTDPAVHVTTTWTVIGSAGGP